MIRIRFRVFEPAEWMQESLVWDSSENVTSFPALVVCSPLLPWASHGDNRCGSTVEPPLQNAPHSPTWEMWSIPGIGPIHQGTSWSGCCLPVFHWTIFFPSLPPPLSPSLQIDRPWMAAIRDPSQWGPHWSWINLTQFCCSSINHFTYHFWMCERPMSPMSHQIGFEKIRWRCNSARIVSRDFLVFSAFFTRAFGRRRLPSLTHKLT